MSINLRLIFIRPSAFTFYADHQIYTMTFLSRKTPYRLE